MITWMQRHKKYLIVTIWVSVISFVGAGFVGWGAYDFNTNRSSSVAKVGNHQISIQSFSATYQTYFNYYNSVLYNGELTEEIAKNIGLDKLVLNAMIEEAVLLNFADETGLIVLDSDIVDFITNDTKFQVNGTFNKELYYRALQNAGFKPAGYEETVKKQVLLNKIYDVATDLPATQFEKEIFGSAMFMQDRLSLGVVTVGNNEINLSENETKTFWETNKDNFLTEKIYFFESIYVPASIEKLDENDIKAYYEETKYLYKDKDDKLLNYNDAKPQVEADLRTENAKKTSLKTYLSFKKGEIAAQKNITVKESSAEYDVSEFQTLSIGDVLTPIKKTNGYEILKLTKVALPEPKSYEEAKSQVTVILKENKRNQLLAERAQSRLNLFSGKDLGFLNLNIQNIPELTKEQSSHLASTILGSKNKRGYVILDGKAFLYNITDQKLPNDAELAENDQVITETIKMIKKNEIRSKLINLLKPRYKIEQYYKG